MSVANQDDIQGGATGADDVDDGADDEGTGGAAPAGGRGADPEAAAAAAESRKQRRADRMREEKERSEAAERRETELRNELAQLRRESSEMRGYLQAQRERGDGGAREAEMAQQVSRLRREAEGHLVRSVEFSKAGDRVSAQAEMDAYHDKIAETMELRRAPQREAEREALRREIQSQQMGPDVMVARDKISREFGSWVHDDAMARNMADGVFNDLLRQGRPNNYETLREACALVAHRLKLGGRQAPTEQNRRALQGVPGGEGGGGGEGSVQIEYGRAERVLAQKLFPTLEGKELESAFKKKMIEQKKKGKW